ncbi:MAG: hypothetical protein ACYTHK_17655 [Planctomycetota bacterium]|jgi:hypothetical protein
MATTYRFLADPERSDDVLEWFRALPAPPHEIEGDGCMWLHFADIGPLLEPDKSPLATVYLPRVRRGVLWTVGEIHFLPEKERFPELSKISGAFGRRLASHPCVFTRNEQGGWDDYLEGTVKNYDPPIYAFPSGFEALQAGRYFVAEHDTRVRLDDLCKKLRLRGIDCEE